MRPRNKLDPWRRPWPPGKLCRSRQGVESPVSAAAGRPRAGSLPGGSADRAAAPEHAANGSGASAAGIPAGLLPVRGTSPPGGRARRQTDRPPAVCRSGDKVLPRSRLRTFLPRFETPSRPSAARACGAWRHRAWPEPRSVGQHRRASSPPTRSGERNRLDGPAPGRPPGKHLRHRAYHRAPSGKRATPSAHAAALRPRKPPRPGYPPPREIAPATAHPSGCP